MSAPEQPAAVDVFFPEQPFGGVLVEAGLLATSVSFPTGSPVRSVFGRIGHVVAVDGDYTLDQIDPPVHNFTLVGKMRIKADGSFQLWNPDQNKWHSLSVSGIAGEEVLVISAGEI